MNVLELEKLQSEVLQKFIESKSKDKCSVLIEFKLNVDLQKFYNKFQELKFENLIKLRIANAIGALVTVNQLKQIISLEDIAIIRLNRKHNI